MRTVEEELFAALRDLEFESTVPRKLTHRRALNEVFLTDGRRVDDERFSAGAQLPLAHPYYTDHAGSREVDPLLLLECCRQAETHAVHAHFRAPLDTRFVLRSWSLDLPAPVVHEPARGPAEVAILASVHDARILDGVPRALSYRMRMVVSGRAAGEVRMHVRYVPDVLYQAMRRRADGSRPPSSDAYRGPAAGVAVEPRRVARTRPENVILLDPTTAPGEVRARLRVAGGHPSLFDHPQDHVPGMVLMEAGRQLALLAAEEFTSRPAPAWRVSRFDASFSAYAELDAPLWVVGRRPAAFGPDGGLTLSVGFEQSGVAVAKATFDLAPVDAA